MNSSKSAVSSPMNNWLAYETGEEKARTSLQFHDHHLGNPLIRSVHGGVTASLIEMSAQTLLTRELGVNIETQLVSSSVDYLRVTRDVNIEARAEIVRISRRLAFIDVWCWQDDEETPIARGTCTLRIMRTPKE